MDTQKEFAKGAKPLIKMNTWSERHEEKSSGPMSAVVSANREYFESAAKAKYGRDSDHHCDVNSDNVINNGIDDKTNKSTRTNVDINNDKSSESNNKINMSKISDVSKSNNSSDVSKSNSINNDNVVNISIDGTKSGTNSWLATDSSRLSSDSSHYYFGEKRSSISSTSTTKTAIEKVRSNEAVSHPESVLIVVSENNCNTKPTFAFGDISSSFAIPRAQINKNVSSEMRESRVDSSDDNDSGVSFLVPRSMPVNNRFGGKIDNHKFGNKFGGKFSDKINEDKHKRSFNKNTNATGKKDNKGVGKEAQLELMQAIRNANGIKSLRKTNARCF